MVILVTIFTEKLNKEKLDKRKQKKEKVSKKCVYFKQNGNMENKSVIHVKVVRVNYNLRKSFR